MKNFIILFSTLLITTATLAQTTLSFLPKWYVAEKDTTFKDKTLIYNGVPVVYKQDKDNNLFILTFTTVGFQLSKIEAMTGKKLWTAERNQSFGIENKMYFPKDFFFRPDGNIVLFATKGLKFPGLSSFSTTIKCVYDSKTGKEIFNFIDEKKGGSAIALNSGGLVDQIIEKPDKKGYYFYDGIGGTQTMSWTRTVDTNFVANDTLYLKLPRADTSKLMKSSVLSPFQQINNKFYQMSMFYGGNDTSRVRTYFTKIDYRNKQYSVKDVSKNWFHGVNSISFCPTKNGFLVSVVVDTAYGPSNGLSYKPNIVLAKIDTNGILEWRTYLFPEKSDYKKGYCITTKDNKTDGYWVVLASQQPGEKSYLYYMTQNGKPKLIGEIKVPDNDFFFYSNIISTLNNGDIVISYRNQNSDAHPIYAKAGTLYYERKQFEALITKDDDRVIPLKNCIVYPNPVEHRLQVLLPTVTAFEYVISDMMGRTVKTESVIATNFHEIAMQDYPKGIYLLSIKTSDNQVFVQKIVKQ